MKALAAPPAEVIEIFSAIQGEGPIVGRRQLFVRFGRCDVKCVYCDTPLCHVTLPTCRVEKTAGRRDFERHANPVDVETLAAWIARLAGRPGLHHSVSFTGGEPLLHAPVIAALADGIRALGMQVYLETNGHLTAELRSVIDAVDIVGMDVKIESTAGFPARFADNAEFLRTARDAKKDVFVKIVVGAATTVDEITAAAALVRDVAPRTTVVLQPVTPHGGVGVPPSPDALLVLHDAALAVLRNVLVIPQTHKMLRQL
jgi:7-carboxy-7-deazaguanine synthase